MDTANVTPCPTTNLLGICKQETSVGGVGTTSSFAVYYYSGIYNATTAKAACLGTSMTTSGMTITTTATWYTEP